jgi:hypothetical protein
MFIRHIVVLPVTTISAAYSLLSCRFHCIHSDRERVSVCMHACVCVFFYNAISS